MKTMTQRQRQRAEQVRQAVSMALLQGQVMSTLPLHRMNIIDCWVSADLRIARVFVSLPEGMAEKPTLEVANRELSIPLRKVLAKALGAKFVPAVSFWPLEDAI